MRGLICWKKMKHLPYTLVKRKKLHAQSEKIAALHAQIQSAQQFIKEIESGNLSIEFDKYFLTADQDNALGESLRSMRDQMHKIAESEKKRNWATEGLAKFVEILRNKNDDLRALGELIISQTVKYMDANQGSLYILNDEDNTNIYLELIGCYAYDRKKFHAQKIALGNGLLGQAVLEKGIVHMTNVPNDYLKITSGLGSSLPKNLMIVPLMINEKVYGAIELASFKIFEEHHRDFLQKLAESIASTISNVRINQQTRRLLEDTQAQAEQMRSQEEEMRQNMEELTATQEEMQRVLKEVQGKEEYLNSVLNASTDVIFTVDRSIKLLSWNKIFQQTQEANGAAAFKGFEILSSLSPQDRVASAELYERAFNGEAIQVKQEFTIHGAKRHFLLGYSPLRSAENTIFAVAVFAKDITELVDAQRKAEKLLNDAQHQTEELKAQEEELRQNMEELSATQDEMQRILKEVESKEAYTNQLLNVSKDSIFTIDKQYKLVSWNQTFAATLERFGLKLEKGLSTLDWYQGEEREKQVVLYNRVLSGESFEFTTGSEQNGESMYFLSVYSPLRNEKGEIFEAAIFAKDVTAMVTAQKNSEKLLHEVQQKEGYLNAILNASKDSIFTLDKEYKLISFNEGFSAGLTKIGINVDKGYNVLDLFPEVNQKDEHTSHYVRAFSGEIFEVTSEFNLNGLTSYYTSSYAPLKNVDGKIFAISVFGKDVTDFVVAKKTAEAMAHQAKEKTEEVKAQEEELRQNLEELSASQEEMHRIMKTLEAKEAYTSELLNASDDMIFTIDRNYKLVSWNKTFAASLDQYGTALNKGMSTLEWYKDGKQRKEQKAVYDRALKGEHFEIVISSEINNKLHYFKNIYKPLKNENGEIYEAVVFARDVTALHQK
jgi:PAS domain S-box-containing protein